MMQAAHFPIKFLALRKAAGGPTAPGIYLRWFVKPYLGLPGIDPLHPSGWDARQIARCGFRLFFTSDTDGIIPQLPKLTLDPLIPDEQQVKTADMATRPGWKAILKKKDPQAQLDIDLQKQHGDQVCYLSFDYSLCAEQTLTLTHKIYTRTTHAETVHQVDIHYNALIERLDRGEEEQLTYAINVDDDDEAIIELSLTSNKSIVLGEILYALSGQLPFFIWSPAGGGGIWKETTPNMHLIQALKAEPSRPGSHQALVRSMSAFYDKYYNLQPHQVVGDARVSFEFPDLTAFGLGQPPLREYIADEYGQLCEGGYEPEPSARQRFYMPPQDAAALASSDPAIAYLLGLFRILESEEEFTGPCVFKVQGTWPDGQRYGIFCVYDPEKKLVPPLMNPIQASPQDSRRVVRDYATFRTHHRINTAEVQWAQIQSGTANQDIWLEPVAYVILGLSHQQKTIACKSPFYVPQDWEIYGRPPEVHFVDWLDYYHKSDIHKVLDGTYTYHVAGFDVFGQLSNFQKATTQVDPVKLEPGEVQRPEIVLSKLPMPSAPDTLEAVDIPLEVKKSSAGFVLRGYQRDYLEFNYSFFWLPDSSYLWDKNRASGNVSVHHFELLYLVDIPLSCDALFDGFDESVGGATVKLEGVGPSTGVGHPPENHQLHALLVKLGAVDDASGNLLTKKVKAALKGGSLLYQQAWDVVDVTVFPSKQIIELHLVPASDSARDELEKQQAGMLRWYILHFEKLTGQLYWNLDASHAGSRIGWKNLTGLGEEIRPAPPKEISANLISETIMPSNALPLPSDLATTVGIVVSRAVPTQVPSQPIEYGFTIRLAKTDELAQYDRFYIVPLDPSSNLQPGEYQKGSPPPGSDVEYPNSVNTLFSEDLIVSFYAAKAADDANYPGKVVYRGNALPFHSNEPNYSDELLLFPSVAHKKWLVFIPTAVNGKPVPLSAITQKGFNQENYLTTTVAMGLVAVAAGQDREVKDSLQKAISTLKLSLVEYLPPPVVQVEGAIPPSFGLAASSPDYHGISLIRVRQIYNQANLDITLASNLHYVLYALPADRVTTSGLDIRYAIDTDSGNIFRRNMAQLKTALEGYHPTDPLSQPGLQKLFAGYAQRVHDDPLTKSEFLNLPVELPGESRTVFLFAIKAYDPVAKKESKLFTGLSRPVYVEDPSPPSDPQIQYSDLVLTTPPAVSRTQYYDLALTMNPPPSDPLKRYFCLHFEICVSRHLTEEPHRRYAKPVELSKNLAEEPYWGYASPDELELSNNLLGPDFCQLVARYRLYLSTGHDEETLISPDDSDFVSITSASTLVGDPAIFSRFDITRFQVMLDPVVLTVQPVQRLQQENPDSIQITAKLQFHHTVDVSNLPPRIYTCLRGENYLGQLSPLKLSPTTYREIV